MVCGYFVQASMSLLKDRIATYNLNMIQQIGVKIRTPVVMSDIKVLAFSLSSVEDNEEDGKMADLLSDFQQQLTLQDSSVKLCQPELDVNQTHISGMS